MRKSGIQILHTSKHVNLPFCVFLSIEHAILCTAWGRLASNSLPILQLHLISKPSAMLATLTQLLILVILTTFSCM
jgi:hypothetical protein